LRAHLEETRGKTKMHVSNFRENVKSMLKWTNFTKFWLTQIFRFRQTIETIWKDIYVVMLEFSCIRVDTEIFMFSFSPKFSYFRGNFFFMKIGENSGNINDMAYLWNGAYD
jgi:hypothetical protein